MFGDDLTVGPSIRVCCGPRCGIAPQHREIFEAIEKTTQSARPSIAVLPAMCQGLCHNGVTVVWPDKNKTKVRDVSEATDSVRDALPRQ